MTEAPTRIQSIDIFRAVTMLVMIFVNDLWTLTGVPKWMEHSATNEDFMGLADAVFPCFLFIVGASIPLAIEKRIAKTESRSNILQHILIRSFALLIMGVFTVNLGSLDPVLTGINEAWFEILMVLGFFLCWNAYPKSSSLSKLGSILLQICGIVLLLLLAFIYRSKVGSDGISHYLQIKWWGILGLIGWAYGLTAIIYLFARKHLWYLIIAWLFFTLINIVAHSGLSGWSFIKSVIIQLPGGGAFQSFAFAGLLLSLIFAAQSFGTNIPDKLKLLIPTGIALLFLFAGLLARNWFIISKNLATPSWIYFSCSIAVALLTFLYWLIDMKGKASWFAVIKPAGTNTLTCYLLPYLAYSLFDLTGFHLSGFLSSGIPGIIKSILFSFLIIILTGLLQKIHIRLKI